MSSIQVDVDERAKREVEAVLAPRGLTSSEFLRWVVERIARQPGALISEGEEGPVSGLLLEPEIVEVEGGDKPVLHSVRQALERIVHDKNLRPVLIDLLDEPLTPNAETIAAIEEARRGEFVGEFSTPEELIAHLNANN
jgi:antitoxin component of RelBE/YafQ-DinJ toxin-antitoxin module